MSDEKLGRLGNTCHMNRMQGGRRGEGGEAVPDHKYVCNEPESFLPVLRSTRNLVNVWGVA